MESLGMGVEGGLGKAFALTGALLLLSLPRVLPWAKSCCPF